MPYPSHNPWLDHSNNIWLRVSVIKLLIMKFSPTSCHFIPLRSKCSSQQPFLKHPQSMFLPYCQSPSFTPIENHRTKHKNNIKKFVWSHIGHTSQFSKKKKVPTPPFPVSWQSTRRSHWFVLFRQSISDRWAQMYVCMNFLAGYQPSYKLLCCESPCIEVTYSPSLLKEGKGKVGI
jgi:hypothetical protein